jgi:hypothetical protein
LVLQGNLRTGDSAGLASQTNHAAGREASVQATACYGTTGLRLLLSFQEQLGTAGTAPADPPEGQLREARREGQPEDAVHEADLEQVLDGGIQAAAAGCHRFWWVQISVPAQHGDRENAVGW